jgi:hypothetical protein
MGELKPSQLLWDVPVLSMCQREHSVIRLFLVTFRPLYVVSR